jgi:hypothetical protein
VGSEEMNLNDLKIKDGLCYRLICIEHSEIGITHTWKEVVKHFLETNLVNVNGDWRKAIDLFKPDEYPVCIKDLTETFVLNKGEVT